MRKASVIFIIAFLSICNLVLSQAPNWLWARSGGGSKSDFGQGICTDANGNVFVTGTFDSTMAFGTTTINSLGYADVFFAKYDSNGNLIWAKSFGGSDGDFGYSIAADINGDIYISGYFFSPTITIGTRTLQNSGTADIFLTKFDTNGNLIWAKRAGGIYWDVANCVTTDALGNVYIAGSFQSNFITFGLTTLANAGDENAFLVKYDSSGNMLWANSYGSIIINVINGVSVDQNGNVLICGSFLSDTINFGATTLYNINYNGGSDIFITKLDPNGNTMWAKSAGGNQYDDPYGITTDAAGNILITGEFASQTINFGAISINSSGYHDFFIAKYDTGGNALWAKIAGGIGYDYGSAIDVDSHGNIYVGGKTSSIPITFGSFTLNTSGYQQVFIVKYDEFGNELWAIGENAQYCNNIYVDPNDDVLVTGSFSYQNLILGNDTLIPTGYDDMYIAKIKGTATGINEKAFNSGILIAPNPFIDQTTITFKEEQKNTSIKISNVIGQEINSIQFTGQQFILEKGTMKPGVYLIQTMDENKNMSNKKIVVQ